MAGKSSGKYGNINDIELNKAVRIPSEQYKKMREEAQRSPTPQASSQIKGQPKYTPQQMQLLLQKQQMQRLRNQQEQFFITLTNQCANGINLIDIKIKAGRAQKADIEKAGSLIGSWSTNALKKFEKEIPKLYPGKATSVFSQFADTVNKALPSQSLANDAKYQEVLQNIRSQSARIVNDINVSCLNACKFLSGVSTMASQLSQALLNVCKSLKSLIQNIKSLPVGGNRENEIMNSPMYKKVFIEDFATIQKFTQEILKMSQSEKNQKALAGYRNELVKLANAMYVLNDDIHKLPHANPKANYIRELANLYLAIIPEGIEKYSYLKYLKYIEEASVNEGLLAETEKKLGECLAMGTIMQIEINGKKLYDLLRTLNARVGSFFVSMGNTSHKKTLDKLKQDIIEFTSLVLDNLAVDCTREDFLEGKLAVKKTLEIKKAVNNYALSIKGINDLVGNLFGNDKLAQNFIKSCDELIIKGFNVLRKNLQQTINSQDKKHFDKVIDLIKKVNVCISKIKEPSVLTYCKEELNLAYQKLLEYFEAISRSLGNKK